MLKLKNTYIVYTVSILLIGCGKESSIKSAIKNEMKSIEFQDADRIEIIYDEYSESDYIQYLINKKFETIRFLLDLRVLQNEVRVGKLLAGEVVDTTVSPTIDDNYYNEIDSLRAIVPDPQKTFYKAFAYVKKSQTDTTWKKIFWLDKDYKIIY